MNSLDPHIVKEVLRRRTFAIISHPDAGKTTLTEKLLLYGGQLEVAGAVRGRKSERAAASDWMELEKQRGISVSSTVLTFEYDGLRVNLLDTPGHHDFSEDTYRTLMAADCAVMVIDLAKGVEPQTQKLFKVCALRKIPVLTFVNKVDRPGRDPLEVLSEIETHLNIAAVPMNWPIGSGLDFHGLVDLEHSEAHLFDKATGRLRVPYRSLPLAELASADMPAKLVAQVAEEVELLESAGSTFDEARFLAGEVTPVYFGSALRNYGVEHFLRGFLATSPPPSDRLSDRGPAPAGRSDFAGFIFKIQANLDPRHRDRVAFLRVCTGRFEREMEVYHTRLGKSLRLRRAQLVFGRERETVEEAYPGDIVGLVSPGSFRLGDTLCVGEPLSFEPLPQFSPEYFAVLRCAESGRRKQFERGLEQLTEEGAIQVFTDPRSNQREHILAAVGELQFDVVRYRLENEYQTETVLEWLPYKQARWVSPRGAEKGGAGEGGAEKGGAEEGGAGEGAPIAPLQTPYTSRTVKDQHGMDAILFKSNWDCEFCERENPAYCFAAVREGLPRGAGAGG